VFDLDGTITRHDTLMPFLFGYLWRHPWRLPRLLLFVPPLLSFAVTNDRGALKGALIHAVLGGCQRSQLEVWAHQFVTQLLRTGVFAEALSAIAAHQQRGERLVLMSASPDLYVPRIAQVLGFDAAICSQVRWHEDGRLEGHLAGSNCRGEEKRHCLAELIARDAPAFVTAYGNSGADLPHMRLAQQAFMVNAEIPVEAARGGRLQQVHWHAVGRF